MSNDYDDIYGDVTASAAEAPAKKEVTLTQEDNKPANRNEEPSSSDKPQASTEQATESLAEDSIPKTFENEWKMFMDYICKPEKMAQKNIKIDTDLIQTIAECNFTARNLAVIVNAALRSFLLSHLDELVKIRKNVKNDSLFTKYIDSK